MVLYYTLVSVTLYMYSSSEITHSYAFLPEDEDGVDTGVAAITTIFMLTAWILNSV